MKKILVTGASGFVGESLRSVPKGLELIGWHYSNANTFFVGKTWPCNLLDGREVERKLATIRPDFILHLGALSSPNTCELKPDLSYALNVEASDCLAKLACSLDIPLIFASTDLVFDGETAFYDETAPTNPLMVYGRHKAVAERLVLNRSSLNTVVRLPLMYGLPMLNDNFLKSWIAAWGKGECIKAFTDEYRTAAFVEDVWSGLFLIIEKELNGVWHLGGNERMSRYDFALKAASVLGYSGALVRPVQQEAVKMAAARPRDVSMNNQKMRSVGYVPRGLEEALQRIRQGL